MHDDELDVPTGVVRGLIAAQFPEWAGLPVERVPSTGTVNAIFRVGERLAARFPLRAGDAREVRGWLAAEAAAARELVGRTRFPVPEPIALGAPGPGYPLPWSVQTWLPGRTADERDPAGSVDFARDVAEFILGVRALDTRGRTFAGAGRGGDLRAHDGWVEDCLARSGALLDVPALRRLWCRLRDLPRTAPDVMTHGDLMPGNVLVADGRLAGVLDIGGLGAADPALDLVGAWHLLDPGPRQVLRDTLRCDDLSWDRGKAWAFEQSLGLVEYYARTNPVMSRTGRRTLTRLLTDPG